jgi:hypothetical protein
LFGEGGPGVSVYGHYFIGPYAFWLVPEGKKQKPPCDEEILYQQHYLGDFPRVKQGGRTFERHCYMPRQPRPGQPREKMWTGGDGPGTEDRDLTEVSPRAEIEWFASAFEPELRALAKYYGGPPTLRWGLVSWIS